MGNSMQHLYRRIYADPEFHELEKKRGRFSWLLTSIILFIYFSFILIIAFAPELFAQKITDTSVISIGIPIGVMVIVCSFLLTGLYVYRSNKEFDALNRDLLERYKENSD